MKEAREIVARVMMNNMFPEHEGRAWEFYTEHDQRLCTRYLDCADEVIECLSYARELDAAISKRKPPK
jgi:hypothetical protein